MYSGIPGRITEIWDDDAGARMARVEFFDEVTTACLAFLPELRVGDYTVVDSGFALTRIDSDSAQLTLAMMMDCGLLRDGMR